MVKLQKIIKRAEERKVAIGHFNVSNLEMLKAVSRVTQKLNIPVIIGVSEGEREYLGVHRIRDLVVSYNNEYAFNIGKPTLSRGLISQKLKSIRGEIESSKVGCQLFLNADHTYSLEKVREAAQNGFDMIVFDGSKMPLEENIQKTKEAVQAAKKINKNVIIEGELGYIGSGSVVRREIPKDVAINPEDLTRPEEAARFVRETGVDMLAPAVGNIHGMFANAPEPRLNIERIREIKKAVKIPLVLHGASGNTDEDLRAAIEAGISVIHISTELRVAWRKGLETALKENPEEIAPYKLMPEGLVKMEKVIENRLKLFTPDLFNK
ncbi:MAG TPA: class II fructose-bisphosphate aldolase [Candidatus Paceibacterota bacterium]|nr:class II fructose-bisphosphate aldolase [Candidatus Paceibacterota bacterium]